MKMLITKYVCDVCGKEINPEDGRRMVAFGIGKWDLDENLSSCTEYTKDVCSSCYDTLRTLLGDPKAWGSKEEEPKKQRVRGDYDAGLIVNLWKKGFTRNEIVAKVGCTKAQANYVIKKAMDRGEVRNTDLHKDTSKTGSEMETVVDENGLVLKTKWV